MLSDDIRKQLNFLISDFPEQQRLRAAWIMPGQAGNEYRTWLANYEANITATRLRLAEQLKTESEQARNTLLTTAEPAKIELPTIETISNTIQNKNMTPLLLLVGLIAAVVILK